MFDLYRRRSGRAGRLRRWAVPVTAAVIVLAAGGGVIAKAASAAGSGGRGPDDFGMTMGSHAGHASSFTYHHGFYCDTHVPAESATGCEAGAAARVAPAKHVDPLFITVPLGFTATVSYGVLVYAFAVFIRPLGAELGWSKARITGAVSLVLVARPTRS